MTDDLLLQYRPRVRSWAFRWLQRLPANIEMDDLVQTGMMGLWDAIRTYSPEKFPGVPFEPFAYKRVIGAMVDMLRELDPLSRDDRRKIKRLGVTRERMRHENLRPTHSALSARLGISMAELTDLLILEEASTEHTPSDTDEDIENLQHDNQCPMSLLEKRQWLCRVQARIEALPPNYKLAVENILAGKRPQETARALGVTDSRASQLLAAVVVYLEKDDAGPLWVRTPKQEASDSAPPAEPDEPFVPNLIYSDSLDALYAEFGDCLKTRSTLVG